MGGFDFEVGEKGENGNRKGAVEPVNGKGNNVVGDEFGNDERPPNGKEDEEPGNETGKDFEGTLGANGMAADVVSNHVNSSSNYKD